MAKRLVLFVHGLGGDPAGTWKRFPDLVRSDDELSAFDIGHFDYPTSPLRMIFWTRYPSVQTLAGALHTQIENRFHDYDDITLVCHSLGGLIAKRYLIDRIELGDGLRVKRMLLFAVPNNGAGLASIATQLSSHHRQAQQLCRESDLVIGISQAWARLKVANQVNVNYVVAALDRVVDEHSARESWDNPAIDVVVDRGHLDVVKPVDENDLSFLILKRFVNATTPLTQSSSAAAEVPPNANLRVAFSALVRIEHGGKYALVRNLHRPETFAPFGGVFKYLPLGQEDLDRLEFRPQVKGSDMQHDLRGFIQARLLAEFVKWFDTGHGRESVNTCLRRELVEETIEIGFELPKGDVQQFRHIRRVAEGPEFIATEDYFQFRIFEVCDLVTETNSAEKLVSQLFAHSVGRKDLVWVTSDEIKKGRAVTGEVIAAHAAYFFGNTRYRQSDPGFSTI